MFTAWFSEIQKEDISLVGGKGANLGELTQSKITVPPGFVVTTEAYTAFLEENHLLEVIANKFDKATGSNEIEGACKEVISMIQKGVFPEQVKSEICENYHKLGDDVRVAVRSSATAEDLAEASFAGQQETYLNIQGEEACLQRIKDCFASCFGYRAVTYRKENHIPVCEVKAAVVIQEMIEADTAGVMFTANVLNGHRDEMVINATYGLGEAVVSGLVTPDQYILNQEGKEIARSIGSKDQKIVYGQKETKTLDVEEKLKSQPALSEADLGILYKEGKNIENVYQKPMDIEWAIRRGKVYILQARPITTLKEEIKWKKETLSKKERESLAFNLEHCPYAYYPLDFEIGMILGDVKSSLMKELGLEMGGDFLMDELGRVTLSRTKLGVNKKIIKFPFIIKDFMNIEKNTQKGNEIIEACKKELLTINKALEASTLTEKECYKLLEALKKNHEKISYVRFRYFIFPSVLYGKSFQSLLKKLGGYSEYDLLSNLPYRTWQINHDLKALGDKLKQNTTFVKTLPFGERQLKKQCLKEWEMIEVFLEKHGQKSDFNCYPFSATSWNENHERFLKVLSSTIKSEKKEENNDKYKRLLAAIRKQTGKKAKKIEEHINYYRLCHVQREETQYMWETGFALMRDVLRKLANIWHIDEESLWFLTYEELTKACKLGLTKEILSKIEMRKGHRKEAESYWNHLSELLVVEEHDGNSIIGTAGSSGVKTGKACLVLDKADFSKLEKNDILICPYTDPEWTPLFAIASAVVSDTGGTLSHAAIVAREYGIPAVLGTGNATAIIKDGDKIQVDGNTGKVTMLGEDKK